MPPTRAHRPRGRQAPSLLASWALQIASSLSFLARRRFSSFKKAHGVCGLSMYRPHQPHFVTAGVVAIFSSLLGSGCGKPPDSFPRIVSAGVSTRYLRARNTWSQNPHRSSRPPSVVVLAKQGWRPSLLLADGHGRSVRFQVTCSPFASFLAPSASPSKEPGKFSNEDLLGTRCPGTPYAIAPFGRTTSTQSPVSFATNFRPSLHGGNRWLGKVPCRLGLSSHDLIL
jgi:hypothetical protein